MGCKDGCKQDLYLLEYQLLKRMGCRVWKRKKS